MKLTKVLVIPVLASVALFAGKSSPSGLSFNCDDGPGTSSGSCYPGHVTFTGTGYPSHVHVTVTMSDGTPVDDATYLAPGGVLSFTEDLFPADTYTVTTSIHGGHLLLDDFTVTTD